jgi:adenylate cyclase
MVEDITSYRRAGLPDDEVAAAAVAQATILDLTSLMEYLFRRQLATAVARQLTSADDMAEAGETPCGVLFADLVGFTSLSQQLDDAELARLVTRFQAEAHDLVSAHGGRVVKTLGDEVMVICDEAPAAADIALRFVETFAEDELVPQARVGLAWGPVLALQGDYFGPTVNLASRLVSMARPGSVLVSPEAHAELADQEPGRWSRLRPHRVKGIGWVTAWVLRREQPVGGEGQRRPWWRPSAPPGEIPGRDTD